MVPLWQTYVFVSYHESKLFNKISKPTIYCRYVDDTFSLFHKEIFSQNFLTLLKSLHPSLKFINQVESNNSLPFLDVFVTKPINRIIILVYKKPTFTGQYIYWDSFGPKQRKTNLIDTLTHRILKICSESTLKHELDNICSIVVENGCPEFLIDFRIFKKLLRFKRNAKERSKKCPVYLKLPWIGKNFLKFDRKIKLCITNCFGAVQQRVYFSTK